MKLWQGRKLLCATYIILGKEKNLISLRYYNIKRSSTGCISKVRWGFWFVFPWDSQCLLLSCSLPFTSFPFSAGGKYLHFLTLSWISSKKYSSATRQVVLKIFQTLLVEQMLGNLPKTSLPDENFMVGPLTACNPSSSNVDSTSDL